MTASAITRVALRASAWRERIAKYLWATLGFAFWVLIAVSIPYAIYNWINNGGFIQHSADTVVTLRGDWMVGEYRECKAWTEVGGRLMSLFCPADVETYPDLRNEHHLPIKFWGRIERPDVEANFYRWRLSSFNHPDMSYDDQIKLANAAEPRWLWRCQRQSDNLICWAQN